MKICIDPGHGGSDPGAVNELYKEAFFNTSISGLLRTELEKRGHEIEMTREDNFTDPPNLKRCRIANAFDADIFVSIHLNSSGNKKAHGHEVIHHPTSKNGKRLAQAISNNLGELPLKSRGIKSDADLGRGFKLTVLHKTRMPAVIVECCFISNQEDLEFIKDPKNAHKVVDAIADGIEAYARFTA